jgi:hypothetical protein
VFVLPHYVFGISAVHTFSVVSLDDSHTCGAFKVGIGTLCSHTSCFMADMLRQIADLPSMEALVQMPIPLSYYIASKLPLQDCTRQELLETEGTVNRLKREIQLLEGMDKLKCNRCRVCMCSAASCLVCDAFVQWFQQAWRVVSVQLICF